MKTITKSLLCSAAMTAGACALATQALALVVCSPGIVGSHNAICLEYCLKACSDTPTPPGSPPTPTCAQTCDALYGATTAANTQSTTQSSGR